MFHNHHAHSYYSLLDGFSSPDELMKRASDLGMNAMSITDHGTLSGHFDMIRAAEKHNVKPILGLEAYFTPDRHDKRSRKERGADDQIYNHLIILSKDDKGLANLNSLSQKAWEEGFFMKPRMDFELLEQNSNGLVVLSGCMNGIIAKAIENGNAAMAKQHAGWFRDVFGDDFYMEIQPHNPASLNRSLLNLADALDIKPVVTLDCHFASPEDRIAEEIMLILGTHPKIMKDSKFEDSRKIKDLMERLEYLYGDRQMSFKDLDIWLMGYDDVRERMIAQGIDREDIYTNSVEISEKISSYSVEIGKDLLPIDKENPDSLLEKRAISGLKKRGLYDSEEYRVRLFEELDIIKSKNFSSYFIVVSNMISWAKGENIMVGAGRGSAAGSLVCYALGITEVDPIKYGLLFFRFINPERNDFPDIDTDFEDARRGEVKDYLTRRYKHVASIATFLTFKDKGVVRDVARAFGVPLPDVNKALKNIETWDQFISSNDTLDFRNKYPEVVKYADVLRGRVRGTGMHAAGIITSKERISNHAPIETRKDTQSDQRIPVVAVDMDQAAEIGLIKIDALGLKTLTVIKDTLLSIERRHGKKIDLTKISLDDRDVYLDLSAGLTRGVFQAEAAPYTSLLIKMGVRNFDELVASNALVRPGAMNTIGADYIARKNGKKPIVFHHEVMKDFTKDTYGCVLYQEQVMLACVHLGGMTMAEADKVRKIIGKKKDAREFDVFKDRFVSGAENLIGRDKAEKLWHDFEAHAGYSFNKSHAVAYSMLSYWTAWLKRYYPLEFIYSILKNEKDKDARTDYLIEAKRLGIKVRLPHINESDMDFTIGTDYILFGLGNIKYISENIAGNIIAQRPYESYENFLKVSSQKGSGINSRAVDALNRVGAAAFKDNPRSGSERENFYEYLNIPEFVQNIPSWISAYMTDLENYEDGNCIIAMGMVKGIKKGDGWSRIDLVDKTGSIGVFHKQDTTVESGRTYVFLIADNRIADFVPTEAFDDKNMNSHPFMKYLKSKTLTLSENEYFVVNTSARKTKAGQKMINAVLCDETKDLFSVVIFPSMYAESLVRMKSGTVTKAILSQTNSGSLTVKEYVK